VGPAECFDVSEEPGPPVEQAARATDGHSLDQLPQSMTITLYFIDARHRVSCRPSIPGEWLEELHELAA
jgi:hypothetical protein